MKQWNFYFSGILYGTFFEEEEEIQVRRLDPFTGHLGEKKPYGAEDDQFFEELCSRSLMEFFCTRAELEKEIAKKPEQFVTKEGRRFQNRRGEAYIERDRKFPMDLFYEEGSIYAAAMSGRDFLAVLVRKGMERKTALSQWEMVYPDTGSLGGGAGEFQPGPVYPVRFLGTWMVPTRDGEQMATDVYVPGEGGIAQTACPGGQGQRFPAVLVRTPYGKGKGASVYYRFVQRGFAVVVQDVRGREDSTGEWQPEYHEVEDGDDTLSWIASQSWSDGQAAMTGGSYLGYVQWAAAASGNPHLKAMLSFVCAGSAFVDIPRRGGCFNSGMLAWAFAMSEQRMRPDLMVREDWDQILDERPIASIPEKALGHEVPFISRWMSHRDMDDFWKMSNWQKRYKGGPVPALIFSGWFDDNGMGTTEALDLVREWPEGSWKAVLGPWKHSGNADYDLHGQYMGEDAIRYDIDLLCMQWLDHFLRGADNGIEKTPRVEYYTLGENRWKSAGAWPPEGGRTRRLYLDGAENGCAGGTGASCGEGSLTFTEKGAGGQDSYVYDPENPAVHLVDMSENELEVPEDYTEEEKRPDILSYTTPVLTEPLTVTGDARVRLYVSCDCPDTDFVVRLTDVDEKGRSVKLADGVLDAKYRRGEEHPEYMEPGQVYEVNLRTTKISNTFLPGHRLRLTVTSSAKNFIFPNSNTKDGFDSPIRQKARITVHRGGGQASFLEIWEETGAASRA